MKQVFRIVMYALAIVFVLVVIAYAHTKVRSVWEEASRRQATLSDVPAQASNTAALKKQLDAALLAMKAVEATIPTSDGLVDVVSAISNVATVSGVSAQVPVVQSSKEAEKDPKALFSDVRIHVVASGSPAALISFLYRIEHLPYLLRIASWKLDTLQQAAVTSFTSTAPAESVVVTPVRGSSLEADIVIVTKKK